MISPESFYTQSLQDSPHCDRVVRVLAAALNAVDPSNAVSLHMLREGSQLTIDEQIYNLDDYARVLLIGFGKASIPMGQAAAQILGNKLTLGLLITKSLPESKVFHHSPISVYKGSHPVPDQNSIDATKKILSLLESTSEDDLVICLISGGGSALLTLPVQGVTLNDIRKLTNTLLACGATINEINCIRKHISQVKRGLLARKAAPAKVATLILSDVIGDPLDVIASGPTSPDHTTYNDAIGIFEKYEILDQIPSRITDHIMKGNLSEIPETPKGNDQVFSRVQNVIVGNNLQAAKAALEQAQDDGFNTLLLSTGIQGEARQVGPILASLLRQVSKSGDPIPRPACIIAGGETTATIRGDGKGGRNQEMALSTVDALSELPDIMLITLATDGEDGPTDAAGAVVTGDTQNRANQSGLDPINFMDRNASYEFFDPLGDLLKPGSTLTNVNDLVFLFHF